MGLGDDIMLTAQARKLAERSGVKVATEYWSEIFVNNPHIAHPGEPVRALRLRNNKPGNRPYILGQLDGHLIFNPNFKTSPGEIYLSEREKEVARERLDGLPSPITFIEPNVKGSFSGENKRWYYWDELIGKVPNIVQVGNGKQVYDTYLGTDSFREAIAILDQAPEGSIIVTTDGGFHHAAAALNIPAVVIWTGYSSPDTLGYQGQWNLQHPLDGTPCGSTKPCEHCREASLALKSDSVITAILECL